MGSNRSAKAEAARSGPPGDPHPALQSQNREGLRPLDQAVHLLSQQAPSGGDGRGGNRPLPLQPGDRIAGQRLHPEPGAQRPFVPVPGCPGEEDRPDRRSREGQKATPIAGGAHERGGPAAPQSPGGDLLVDGPAPLWSRTETHGMLPPARQRPRVFPEPDRGPGWQRRQGPPHRGSRGCQRASSPASPSRQAAARGGSEEGPGAGRSAQRPGAEVPHPSPPISSKTATTSGRSRSSWATAT